MRTCDIAPTHESLVGPVFCPESLGNLFARNPVARPNLKVFGFLLRYCDVSAFSAVVRSPTVVKLMDEFGFIERDVEWEGMSRLTRRDATPDLIFELLARHSDLFGRQK